MIWALGVLILLVLAGGTLVWRVCVSRGAHLWGRDYLRGRRERRGLNPSRPVHVMFCLADHFEPAVGDADVETQAARVRAYVERLPQAVGSHRDADGRRPIQTMFLPIEEIRHAHLEALAGLVEEQLVEVEVHLHHDDDTAENLRTTLERARTWYSSYGYLSHEHGGDRVRFGFIHGNWALDNSHPKGIWCGVNSELRVLSESGCYADFTFPSAPSLTQTRTVNRIYYATDDVERPRSADFGVEVRAGSEPTGEVMLIQGPLCPNWKKRKYGILPRLENGELSAANPATAGRGELWVRQHIHVRARPEWVFVKVHTHGASESAADMLLGPQRDLLHRILQDRCNDGARHVLHYVSARELYNIVKAAEAGHAGDPNDYRDYLLVPMNR